MLDFVKVIENPKNNGRVIEILPVFDAKHKSKDIMTNGREFYAIWDEELGIWITDFNEALRLIDNEIDNYIKEKGYDNNPYITIAPKYVGTISSLNKQIDSFKQFCKDYQYKNDALDSKLVFLSDKVDKNLHSSKRLPYDIKRGSYECYDELMSTLYSKDERRKIEWAIGSILAGDSPKIQKFYVLYGKAGTGKSTVLNIIDMIFEGYTKPFKSADLGSSAKDFALSVFSSNPLVLIEHDGDLSRIDDNTKLNSIASHERMMVNEKYKKEYSLKPIATMFIGTNKPVKITDGRSGLLRRLIDISPSDNLIPKRRYDYLCKQIPNEIPAIAWHCMNIYNRLGIDYYKDYVPDKMKDVTDHFYDFILEYADTYRNGVTLAQAFTDYKDYCEFSNVTYSYSKSKFKQEMFIYFTNFDIEKMVDGSHYKNFFSGFHLPKSSIVENVADEEEQTDIFDTWLEFKEQASLFDKEMAEMPAQLATKNETPIVKWDDCKTKLHDISTDKLHYTKMPENHIVIDFDLKDENGNKSFQKNLEAATEWPPTYAELSKSGEGIHLHYIYEGDASLLERLYSTDIEVKVFTGNSSLRRRLSKCNDIPISVIKKPLPLKKGGKVVSAEAISNEKHLRAMIKKNLRKEIHASTKPSVDFIFQLLEDAYDSGMHYDVTDMRPAIFAFAANSTHQAEYCLKKVGDMKFCSDEPSDNPELNIPKDADIPIVFYDVEVFPNLFLVNYKIAGEGHKVVRMINPTPNEVRALFKYRLVGFNCRRYDNHIMYARSQGYSNAELYRLSQRIVSKDSGGNCFFREAYNLSYTDIYDYCSKKQSLKKWEIQLGIHHQELGLPWDQPVAEELWPKVAEYCDNDVIATEAVWNATQADFIAREILAEIAGGTVNDTTNSLTQKIIFGNEKDTQKYLHHRDLAVPVTELEPDMKEFLEESFPEMMAEPHGPAKSLLPYFPGYSFDGKESSYKEFNGTVSERNPNGKPVGEGGLVWAKPGMYERVFTFDVASMHPHSAMAEYLFGLFTHQFHDLVTLRVAVKHKDVEKAKTLLNGVLAKYFENPDESIFKTLAYALKIAINSVYGLTSAKFKNAFHSEDNKDNIVAKRGALFMIDLKEEIEKLGGVPIHVKTDSIKVVNPSKSLMDFIFAFGKRYGYTFEIEHIFEKICLVNDAVYIGKLATDDEEWIADCEKAKKDGKPIPTRWTATGTQFAVPYVLKTLFTHEPLEFNDFCETKEVQGALYLDMNEGLPEIDIWEKELKDRKSKGVMYKNPQCQSCTDEDLKRLISQGHSYRFIGKVGQFCPVKPGCGGGEIVREAVNKETGEITYPSATGCKGYKWLESEFVRQSGKENDIDESYYKALANDAITTIEQFGDFEWFSSDDSVDIVPFEGGKIVKAA